MTTNVKIFKSDKRKNLVFGFAYVPHPVEKAFVEVDFDGSKEAELAEVARAYREVYPNIPEQNLWNHVVATFPDHLIVEVSSPVGQGYAKIEYSADGDGFKFDEPSRIEVDVVAKELQESLLQKSEPKVDLEGDTIEMDVLEEGAYAFVLESRIAGTRHKEIGVGELVESVVLSKEKLTAMGIPDEYHDNIPKGWWVGFHVNDEVMDAVESGEYEMFSLGGGALAAPQTS